MPIYLCRCLFAKFLQSRFGAGARTLGDARAAARALHNKSAANHSKRGRPWGGLQPINTHTTQKSRCDSPTEGKLFRWGGSAFFCGCFAVHGFRAVHVTLYGRSKIQKKVHSPSKSLPRARTARKCAKICPLKCALAAMLLLQCTLSPNQQS